MGLDIDITILWGAYVPEDHPLYKDMCSTLDDNDWDNAPYLNYNICCEIDECTDNTKIFIYFKSENYDLFRWYKGHIEFTSPDLNEIEQFKENIAKYNLTYGQFIIRRLSC